MIPILETSRLLLRPLELSDAPQVQLLFARWEIVAFLAEGVPWPYPDDGAQVYIRECALPAMARGDEFFWTLRLKEQPADAIGIITLRQSGNDQRGLWIGLPWQGRGLMSEAAHAVTDFWFEVLGKPVLRVQKAIENEASQRVSIAQGMRRTAEFEKAFVCGTRPAAQWEITAAEWALHTEQGFRRRAGE